MKISKEAKTQFLTLYNPDYQKRICHDVRECLFGDYPTLGEVRSRYGEKMPQAWLMPQLYNLSEYCGVKDKLEGQPMGDTAYVLATEYHYLKISEFMLFFHRFKAGYYGRFYGNIDPLVITTSLHLFIKERNAEWDKEEQRKREQARVSVEDKARAYNDWCSQNGLNPEEQETAIRYFNLVKDKN